MLRRGAASRTAPRAAAAPLVTRGGASRPSGAGRRCPAAPPPVPHRRRAEHAPVLRSGGRAAGHLAQGSPPFGARGARRLPHRRPPPPPRSLLHPNSSPWLALRLTSARRSRRGHAPVLCGPDAAGAAPGSANSRASWLCLSTAAPLIRWVPRSRRSQYQTKPLSPTTQRLPAALSVFVSSLRGAGRLHEEPLIRLQARLQRQSGRAEQLGNVRAPKHFWDWRCDH
ncbi:hypothetical protein PAHAL_5G517300 [Panicum hallii]|uniref:Uncharacterized protein n=1 Tax=Panicum hallii TaxID=206008 RepID=A0A2S3HYU4_9POAL|nr:hypothetical protein PAHAL_5G517300 [Panicum hallii]